MYLFILDMYNIINRKKNMKWSFVVVVGCYDHCGVVKNIFK